MQGDVSRERLTTRRTDWIDYWSVEFDHGSRKEMVRRLKGMGAQANFADPALSGTVERVDSWTGYVFEKIAELRNPAGPVARVGDASHPHAQARRYQLAVKVIDIFGNDTMTLLPVRIG